uniref:Pre-rRNA-processing protein TSR2 homolog n=1 Tax=Timspurckia oligopyrenoides TaxID=708627 RepID=A0A7S0ZFQ2_9RHOD|mmetsp:Transcript_3484/g.6104  ORF Transcript_3484/g.6104 Transcript_3484/m.6104 type:complete len:180 (+) Transcript_3484:73-612(+)
MADDRPEALKELERGVYAAFARWTAVQIAIQERFGGRETEDIIRDLMSECVFAAASERPASVEQIADKMYDAFDSMNCDLEDGSPEEMATMILDLRAACLAGDFSKIRELERKAALDSNAVMSLCVRDIRNDDDDDETMDTSEASSSVRNTQNQYQEPIVDEDGFTVVQPKGRRRDRPM